MMDNAPEWPQAGALPLRALGNSVLKTLCIKVLHASVWHIKAYTPSVLKQSGFKCFWEAPAVPFCLAHCCFLKTGPVHFDSNGILCGNSALCY